MDLLEYPLRNGSYAFMHSSDFRWDDLRVFLAILREGSFSAAAKRLGVEQSTVSRRVAALERVVSGVLFDRQSTGPVPTPLAQTLAPIAERTEAEARRILEASLGASRQISGRVRLALTESFATQVVIPQILPGLFAAHPHIELDLIVDDRSADLSRREADLALRHYRPTGGELTIQRLATLERVAMASRAYMRGRENCAVSDLDWIVQTLPLSHSQDEAFVVEQLGVKSRLRATGHMAQISAVIAGLGVSILTRAQMSFSSELVEVPLPPPEPPSVSVWLVAPMTLRRVPRVAAVWEYIEQAARVTLQQLSA